MDDTRPPDMTNSKKSGAVRTQVPEKNDLDLEKIILMPSQRLNELAVLNPSVYQDSQKGPWPFVYRTEIPNKFGKISVIDLKWLETPTKLIPGKTTIIRPNRKEYDRLGCEDPRLTKVNNTYFITYTAWDGINARIAYATTKDFVNIQKHGIIGPQIPLKEAIDIVEEDIYKQVWTKSLKEAEKRKQHPNLKQIITGDKEIYLWDKDAAIHYDPKNKKWVLFHRLDPHMHIAKTDKLEDLKDNDFWRDYLKNISKHTSIKHTEPWACKKTGWGSPLFKVGDKRLGLYHGVNEDLDYSGSFCEFDDSYNLISVIRNPLLKPDKDIHLFKHTDENGNEKLKKVIFPTGAIVQGKKLYVYSGIADTFIGVRSTDIDWVYSELNHPYNRLKENMRE